MTKHRLTAKDHEIIAKLAKEMSNAGDPEAFRAIHDRLSAYMKSVSNRKELPKGWEIKPIKARLHDQDIAGIYDVTDGETNIDLPMNYDG